MNYKIKVGSEAESKEVQGLFFELGGGWGNGRAVVENTESECLFLTNSVCITHTPFVDNYFYKHEAVELTIPQLKDIVVLKRNMISDATHTDQDNWKWFIGSDGIGYVWQCGNADNLKQWDQSSLGMVDLKPITKEPIMKEFLNKSEDGTYKLVLLDSVADGVDGLIEVPDGSMFATGRDVIFRKNNYVFVDGMWRLTNVTVDNAKTLSLNIVWQRETLNDKVASAEVARQEFIGAPFSDLPEVNFEAVDDFVESNVEQGVKHAHYKKDISHLDTLDIYRVTELFNPHSCGAHIAKKALCSGQRGHKDLLTDIQDIIDTAERWKEMLIEDEKAK